MALSQCDNNVLIDGTTESGQNHLDYLSELVLLVETVSENQEGFTKRQVDGAKRATGALRLL